MTKSLKSTLLEVMKEKGIKIPQLAKETSIPKERIYKWFSEGSNPKAEDSLILSTWIEKRQMEKVPRENMLFEPPSTYRKKEIPVFEGGPGTLPDFFWKGIPRLDDCDFAVRAKGVAMSSLIREGSIVIGKQLHDIYNIVMGEIYIIETKEQDFIRYVNQHENKDYFLLQPYNAKAGNTEIRKDKVLKIFEYRACFQFA